MTLSSNSWAKFKGDKSRAIPSFAKVIYVQVRAVCWPTFSTFTRGVATGC